MNSTRQPQRLLTLVDAEFEEYLRVWEDNMGGELKVQHEVVQEFGYVCKFENNYLFD